MSLQYSIKHFNDLTTKELYDILKERINVFIIEQNCPYEECDDKDIEAYHILGKDTNNKIQAYCRLLSKGVSYEKYTSIGRVITSKECRGKGEGKKLMQFAIEQMIKIFPDYEIKISAQSYAIPFYAGLGFVVVGNEYMEDDIPHVGMIYSNN
jgi:ElaA protein